MQGEGWRHLKIFQRDFDDYFFFIITSKYKIGLKEKDFKLCVLGGEWGRIKMGSRNVRKEDLDDRLFSLFSD